MSDMSRNAPTFLTSAALLVALGGVVACSHGPEASASPTAQGAGAPNDPLVAFETVRQVLQDPRCQNCHPAVDTPLQGDESRVHDQNIQRGADGHGAPGAQCSTCHGKANAPESYGLRQPPGVATDWHLPPPDMRMVFVGKSSRELCEQVKDPTRNGGKDKAALLQHVSSDPLVLWGWSPGFGRKPVAIPHVQFVAAFKRWSDAGAPCPP
jgi:hypothetical protein